MTCCYSFEGAAEQHFNQQKATEELRRFRNKGPGATTRLLQEALERTGALGGRLIDVGSGVGGLTFGLLDRGISSAIAVDASPAYLAAAAQEAERRHRGDVIRLVQGDFVAVSSDFPSADVVTLDRVVCCYPSFVSLLTEAMNHADRCLALSYPRDVWFVRAGAVAENGLRRFKGNPFRTFVHPAYQMRQLISHAGFDLAGRSRTWTWCVDVYLRRTAAPAASPAA